MNVPRRTSTTVFITLAELAWLMLFGLLFAYQQSRTENGRKDDQIRAMQQDILKAQGASTNWAATQQDLIKLRGATNTLTVLVRKLEQDIQTLQQERDASAHARRMLEQEIAQLRQWSNSWVTATNALSTNLANEKGALARLLSEYNRKAQELELAEKEKERWKQLRAEAEAHALALQGQIKTLEARLRLFDRYFSGTPPAELEARLTILLTAEKNLQQARADLERVQKERQIAVGLVADLERRLALITAASTSVPTHTNAVSGHEYAIRLELTGIPTRELNRVIFLVDTSSSVRSNPQVWSSVRGLIQRWLVYLPVRECALVNFSDKATNFPDKTYLTANNLPDNTYLKMRDASGGEIRDAKGRLSTEILLTALDATKQGVFTRLDHGLACAKTNYPPADLIVLFTDGQPKEVRNDNRNNQLATNILNKIHGSPPILAIAVGRYEVEGDGTSARTNAGIKFLKDLAAKTGGNFLAR